MKEGLYWSEVTKESNVPFFVLRFTEKNYNLLTQIKDPIPKRLSTSKNVYIKVLKVEMETLKILPQTIRLPYDTLRICFF